MRPMLPLLQVTGSLLILQHLAPSSIPHTCSKQDQVFALLQPLDPVLILVYTTLSHLGTGLLAPRSAVCLCNGL